MYISVHPDISTLTKQQCRYSDVHETFLEDAMVNIKPVCLLVSYTFHLFLHGRHLPASHVNS